MSGTKILQIEGIEAATIFNRFERLQSEVEEIKTALSGSKESSIWITRIQVSKMLGVSLVTVNDWANKGIIQPYKIANRIYFKRSEIEQALTPINPRRR